MITYALIKVVVTGLFFVVLFLDWLSLDAFNLSNTRFSFLAILTLVVGGVFITEFKLLWSML